MNLEPTRILRFCTSLLTVATAIVLVLFVAGCACPGRDLPVSALDKGLLQDSDSSQDYDDEP